MASGNTGNTQCPQYLLFKTKPGSTQLHSFLLQKDFLLTPFSLYLAFRKRNMA
jgi:hypothetical protein